CNQQSSMIHSHVKVVGDHPDNLDDSVEKVATAAAGRALCELDAHGQLRNGDCSDGNVIFVADHPVEVATRAFGVDQEGGVEYEATQDRSSMATSSRVAMRSASHALSALRCRSRALTSTPWPIETGSSWATTLPLRTMVKRSPRCSTASSSSAKFRAALVALISFMGSDYQIKCGLAASG